MMVAVMMVAMMSALVVVDSARAKWDHPNEDLSFTVSEQKKSLHHNRLEKSHLSVG